MVFSVQQTGWRGNTTLVSETQEVSTHMAAEWMTIWTTTLLFHKHLKYRDVTLYLHGVGGGEQTICIGNITESVRTEEGSSSTCNYLPDFLVPVGANSGLYMYVVIPGSGTWSRWTKPQSSAALTAHLEYSNGKTAL